MRYEHWLFAAKPSPWPSAMLCLDTVTAWDKSQPEDAREHVRLIEWHITLCVRHGDGFAIGREASGATVDGFWDAIRTASVRSKNLWILSSCFRRDAAALQLWQQMESGNVRLVGRDWRELHTGGRPLPAVRRAGETGMEPGAADVGRDNLPTMSEIPQPDTRPGSGRTARPRNRSGGICVLEDPPIILAVKVDGGGPKITWVDAANYGVDIQPQGFQSMTQAHGLADWFVRAASTIQSLGKCGWQPTAGSQAMHLFRSSYLDTPILAHTHPRVTALERGGLFGGRCEAFRTGRIPGTSHLYDIRSMYPYLCATVPVPISLDSLELAPSLQSLCTEERSTIAIAEVEIETESPCYPCRIGPDTVLWLSPTESIHARSRFGNEHAVIYPTGRFRTVLSASELRHAAESRAISRVLYMARYKAGYALRGYAETLYAHRQQADGNENVPLAAWIKRLMVALPGKFAQQQAGWEDMPLAECPWEWGEWYRSNESGEMQRWRVLAGNIQREQKGGFSHGTVPAITCVITAAGRKRLLEIIHAAGRENTSYCDTDAIIVNDAGEAALIAAGWVRPGEWGYLQHVCSSDDAFIAGPKHYRIGERVRQAGMGPVGIHDAANEGGAGSQPTVRNALRRQERPADWRTAIVAPDIGGKTREVRPAGGWVRPYELREW